MLNLKVDYFVNPLAGTILFQIESSSDMLKMIPSMEDKKTNAIRSSYKTKLNKKTIEVLLIF